MRPKILIIAPDRKSVQPFQSALTENGLSVTTLEQAEALDRLRHADSFDLVITLWHTQLKNKKPDVPKDTTLDALFLSGPAISRHKIQASQNGFYRFHNGSLDIRKFAQTVASLLPPNPQPNAPLLQTDSLSKLIGASPQIQEIRQQIKTISRHPGLPVLITGETGTGKELVADLLYASSPRTGKPFIKVNCSALPEHLAESQLFGHRRGAFTGATTAQKGLVELANGGVFFLDEISTLPLSLQAKLLRFLEDGSYRILGDARESHSDAWVLAATNEDLRTLVEKRSFRKDLYYRLKGFEIVIPPLRERQEDIVILAISFLQKAAEPFSEKQSLMTEDAMQALKKYVWPGNVRELRNLIQSLVPAMHGKKIAVCDLPEKIFTNQKVLHDCEIMPLKDAERLHIRKALKINNGRIRKTAKALEITPKTLRNKIRQLGLLSDDTIEIPLK